MLGVAVSADVLMQNIENMTKNPGRYFRPEEIHVVMQDPTLIGDLDDIIYQPGCGSKKLSVTVRGSGTTEEMEKRALRNLAYKILRERATHGVDYSMKSEKGSVTMQAMPVILTKKF